MISEIMEFNPSSKVPLFVRTKQIVDLENIYSAEEIVKTIDELTEYEKEIRNIKQQIIDTTCVRTNRYYERESAAEIDMSTKIRNSDEMPKEIIIVTREKVKLEPGEEIELTGDIELESDY
jgi:hypothetical protein